MHWPAPGVASIWRKSAFISSGFSGRPERTEWWQAKVPSYSSSRPGEALRAVLGGEIGGEIAHEAGEVALRDHRRRLAHQDRARPEAFDDEAERGQVLGVRLDQPGRVRIEIDDHRDGAASAARSPRPSRWRFSVS